MTASILVGRCQPGRELVEGQQASGIEPAAVGGKGRGYFGGHFCGPTSPAGFEMA